MLNRRDDDPVRLKLIDPGRTNIRAANGEDDSIERSAVRCAEIAVGDAEVELTVASICRRSNCMGNSFGVDINARHKSGIPG
jgi:hypothetical protein